MNTLRGANLLPVTSLLQLIKVTSLAPLLGVHAVLTLTYLGLTRTADFGLRARSRDQLPCWRLCLLNKFTQQLFGPALPPRKLPAAGPRICPGC